MKTKHCVRLSLVLFCNIYFHTQFVNNVKAQEISCCCSRGYMTRFMVTKCLSGILSNNSFVQCEDANEILIDCSTGPRGKLEIEPRAFQNLHDLTNVYIINYNINYLPDRLFCNLKKLREITFKNTSIKDIYNKGFGNECGEDHLPNFRAIGFPNSEIEILRNNAFIRMKNAIAIDMSNNHLKEIEDGAFEGLEKLSSLWLSYNSLSFLPEKLFKDLRNLRILKLNSNRLTTQSLTNLKYLKKLIDLTLDYNFITGLNMTLIPRTIRHLHLSGNSIEIKENTFHSLPNLDRLYISNANLTHLHDDTFSTLTSLRDLNLAQNNITSIDKDLLKSCPINQLNLSSNKLTSLPDLNTPSLTKLISLILSYNYITNIDKICLLLPSTNMEILDLSFNEIVYINGSFQCFDSMITLKLSHNRIEITASSKFIAPPELQHLFLDYNQITSVTESVFSCRKCETISLEYNNISVIYTDVLTVNIKLLNVSHNNIENDGIIIPSSLNSFVIIVDISFNQLTKFKLIWILNAFTEVYANDNFIELIDLSDVDIIPTDESNKLHLHNNNLTRLCLQSDGPLTLTLSNNPLICTCELDYYLFPTNYIHKRISVVDLDAVKCKNPFPKLNADYEFVSIVDKSENMLCKSDYRSEKSCSCDSDEFADVKCKFQCPKPCTCYNNKEAFFAIVDCSLLNITIVPVINISSVNLDVYLDGNHIKEIDQNSFQSINAIRKLFLNNSQVERIHENAFKNIKDLKVLNLSNNRLKTISADVFYHLTILSELDFSNNHFSNLSIKILSSLKSIKILKLNNNLFHEFSFWTLNFSDKLQLLAIQDNPWSCECDFVVKFLKWLSDYSTIIDNRDAISCKDDSGNNRSINIDEFSHCYVSDSFVLDTTPIWASVLAVTCVIGFIAGLIFYYRREMQVLIYSRYRVRLFHKQSDADADKLFDVFVAYSGEDEEFVVTNVLPGLENIDQPYRTCVHNRDFVAGGYITDNIIEAVQLSRRTLIVLTENFVKSEWCRFEFKTAHSEMLRDQRNRVIVVVINEVPNHVDKELQLYLKTKTYLKWDDRLFWQRLYFALPDKQ